MSQILIRLNAHHPQALADFFGRAFGFEPDQADAGSVTLTLGSSRLQIIGCAGQAYPSFVPGWSPLFQHFAMTVHDMDAAMARLNRAGGWTAISEGGPQTLPANTGGVAAFKFRDPEGHPLELISFPNQAADAPSRIDHSAISVANTQTSIAFYQSLGLTVGSRTLNKGLEQDRLDGLVGAEVDVTALQLPEAPPHVELLCYRGDYRRSTARPALDDVAATQLAWTTTVDLGTFASRLAGFVVHFERRRSLILRDPDGHLLRLSPD